MKSTKSDYKIAVFDIGKSNKKITVFSKDLKILHKESVNIDEINIKGFLCDDSDQLTSWMIKKLSDMARRIPVEVISITTHGATVVLVDKKGQLAFPIISYNQEPEKEIYDEFYRKMGRREDLYLKTGTPPFGQLLNIAIHLFWLQEKQPQGLKKVSDILFFPQYLGYVLTGKKAMEKTYIGSHTYLYDFGLNELSGVTKQLNILDKLPARFSNAWDTLGTLRPELAEKTKLDPQCKVAVGIHDSSAALLVYLLTLGENIVLASTGTWCVFMYPGADFAPTSEGMQKNIQYYLEPLGRPVQSAIFKGGDEHDHYARLIEKRFSRNPRGSPLNLDILKDILSSNDCFVIPPLTPGTGQFPNSKARIIREDKFYKSPEQAYHILNLSLAVQSLIAIKLIVGNKNIPIFIEGGFSNNEIYTRIFSTLLPEVKVSTTNLQEATSLGTAICGKCAYEGLDPKQLGSELVDINETVVEKLDIDKNRLDNYVNKFVEYCKG